MRSAKRSPNLGPRRSTGAKSKQKSKPESKVRAARSANRHPARVRPRLSIEPPELIFTRYLERAFVGLSLCRIFHPCLEEEVALRWLAFLPLDVSCHWLQWRNPLPRGHTFYDKRKMFLQAEPPGGDVFGDCNGVAGRSGIGTGVRHSQIVWRLRRWKSRGRPDRG